MEHILIGKDLLLKTDHIVSANLSAKTNDDKDCIKVKLLDGTQWTVYSNLAKSKEILRTIPKINDQHELIEQLKDCVYKGRIGRNPIVLAELKDILNKQL